MINLTKTTHLGITSLFIAAVLVTTSLASIGMMQTNAAAVEHTIYQSNFRQNSAFATKTIEEGSITTTAYAVAHTNSDGDEIICIGFYQYDANTDTYPTDFFGCGPAAQLAINGLHSATFSGTITGSDFPSDKEMTVTVTGDLTATGKPETRVDRQHINSEFITFVSHVNGQTVSASGSLDISGDLTFSTDDASGNIDNARSGSLLVYRNS